ncbi:hypothetical protein [Alkalihalobacillus sp. 1P02AB]|uniref:capsular polysaccharide export protein, LipB/KpsS family n=1 Tax=Alkalihalobacillus sp. 1P02AB TaxID=3132260 RepID=UPI0039A7043D
MIFVKKFNIHSLIKNALAVITINSTVGIEALTQHKRVITLGEALYNIEGITWHCKHPSDLANVLKTSLNEQVNHSLIDKYLYYLRFHYQIEGTLNGGHPVTSKNIAERLLAGVEREEGIV